MTNRLDNMESMFDEVVAALRKRIADPKCPPNVYATAVKFLADNSVTSIPTEDGALAELRDAIPDHIWNKK